jgi:hypothetical protein
MSPVFLIDILTVVLREVQEYERGIAPSQRTSQRQSSGNPKSSLGVVSVAVEL